MILKGEYVPPAFSKRGDMNGTLFIDQFTKEALYILDDAVNSLLQSPPEHVNKVTATDLEDDDEDDETITWQLSLTPTAMTLDTNILTVSGLEKVLDLIRLNVKSQLVKPQGSKERVNTRPFDSLLFQRIIRPVLQLSTVITIPRADHLNKYNTIQMMRHFVQSFIDCGYSFFVDVPTLLANTEMILSKPSAAKEHTIEALLVLSICTLMCRHTTIHHRGDMNIANSLGYTYYSQARQILQDLFDVHHISVVQSLFILSLYTQGHNNLFSPTRIKSPLLTMAIRMAMAMDLHKLDIYRQNESDQKEKLRRLAWIILCADYFAEWNSTGHTGLISTVDWHVDFPQPLPNERPVNQIDYFSQYCRIVFLRKLDVFKSAYLVRLKSEHPLASGLDHKLFETYFNTPDKFKINCENLNPTWSKSDIESLLLHELYCHTQIFALLPFIPERYIEQFVKDEDAFLFSDINEIYQQIKQTDPNRGNAPFTHLLGRNLFRRQTPHHVNKEDEFQYIVDLLTVINKYTLILEALTTIDTIGCYHSPVFGAILTIHLYLIIENTCSYPDIVHVCQINLLRTQRILRQARSIYADPAILYLERMLTRHHIIPKEEVFICTLHTKTQEILNTLQSANI